MKHYAYNERINIMTHLDYALAGYEGRKSECPPYDSSTVGMAFHLGEWCKAKGILPQEIKPSRGYSWIINRTLKIKFTFSPVYVSGYLITLN